MMRCIVLLSSAVVCSLWVGCAVVLGADPLIYDAMDASVGPTLSVSRDSVDFGVVACGTVPVDVPLVVTNRGTAPLDWSATLSDNAPFLLLFTSGGKLRPNETATILVGSLAIPPTDAAGTTKQGILTITSNDLRTPSRDLLVEVASGGGALDVVPEELAFGESPLSVPAEDVAVVLKNTGNLPITVQLAQPSNPQYALAWTANPAPVSLDPGQSMPGLVGKFTPNTVGATTATSVISVTGVTCGPVQSALTLRGTGTTSKASVQPALLDWGRVPCGTTAASKAVTIANAGATPFNFTAALGQGAQSHFTLVAPSGTVAASSASALGVNPKAIPTDGGVADNAYGDLLAISTTALGDNPHPVTLRMSPQGVILTTNRPSINFGNVTHGTSKSVNVVLSNTGNVAAQITLTRTGSAVFSVTPVSGVIGFGSSLVATVKCSPAAVGLTTGTIVVGTISPVCLPLPAPIQLSCNAT